MQRILGAERRPCRQFNLSAVHRACARTTNLDTSPAHHQFAWRRSRAVGMPPRQMSVTRSDEPRALVFENGSERGGPGADNELVQVRADQLRERELRRRYGFHDLLLPGSVLHRRSLRS